MADCPQDLWKSSFDQNREQAADGGASTGVHLLEIFRTFRVDIPDLTFPLVKVGSGDCEGGCAQAWWRDVHCDTPQVHNGRAAIHKPCGWRRLSSTSEAVRLTDGRGKRPRDVSLTAEAVSLDQVVGAGT